MIIAHHLVLTGYGHWLPNDPRGSDSLQTFTPELAAIAEMHFGRRKTQPSRDQLKEFHRKAEKLLAHPVLWFEQAGRARIAEAIGEVISEQHLVCYACAVLSCHVHLLIRRHRLRGHEMVTILKERIQRRMHESRTVPGEHPVFSADMRVYYKYDPRSVRACIDYIYGNFAKHRIPPVEYEFVSPYDDWPFHKHMTPPHVAPPNGLAILRRCSVVDVRLEGDTGRGARLRLS